MAVVYTTSDLVSAIIQGKWAEAISLSADSGVSETNKDRINIANTALFSVGDNVRITDNTEITGEDKVVETITVNSYLTVVTDMANDYTTVLSGKVQIKSTFSNRSSPSKETIEAWINEAEDDIDKKTNNAWRLVTVTDEYYDIPRKSSGINYNRYSHDGIPIYLRHRNITTFVADTDKIEVWDGSDWIEWVGTKTEGRDQDYWLDNERGVLYLRLFWPHFLTKAIRLTYRHGESSVPGDIQKACSLMVAIKVLQSEDRSFNLPETGDPTRLTYDNRISQWKAEIKKIIKDHTDIAII